MDEVWWLLNGPATYGEDIPMFSHMDWYISRLKENRPHDLSHSGLQYDWSQILDEIGDISDLLVHPEFDGVDLRELVAERENIGRSRVVMTQGVTDAIHLALSAALPKDAKKVAVEVPAYAPVCHSARLIGLETVGSNRPVVLRDSFRRRKYCESACIQILFPSKLGIGRIAGSRPPFAQFLR